MLSEYRGDILDSLVQTLKYLQYEFFAASAHAISNILPSRMEFRPMIEMTPEQLKPQVALELQAAEEQGEESDIYTTTKILEKWEREGAFPNAAEPVVPVDPLSLSVLVAQGFKEGPARKALRIHGNDTQTALDWLLTGQKEQPKSQPSCESVRVPTTLKWVQKLKDRRRKEKDRKHQTTASDGESPKKQSSSCGEDESEQKATKPYRTKNVSKHRRRTHNAEASLDNRASVAGSNTSPRKGSTSSSSGTSASPQSTVPQDPLIDFFEDTDTGEISSALLIDLNGQGQPPMTDLLPVTKNPPNDVSGSFYSSIALIDFDELPPTEIGPKMSTLSLPAISGGFDPSACTLSSKYYDASIQGANRQGSALVETTVNNPPINAELYMMTEFNEI